MKSLLTLFCAAFLLQSAPILAASSAPKVETADSVKAEMKTEIDKLKAQHKDQSAKLRVQQKEQRDKLKTDQRQQLAKLKADHKTRWQKFKSQVASNDAPARQ